MERRHAPDTFGTASQPSPEFIMTDGPFPLLRIRPALAVAIALLGASAHAQVALTGGTYAESFDSMATTGTAPPSGWRMLTSPTGSNSTWTNATGISASGVAALTATAGGLTATTTPGSTNNNGFNAALSPSATGDRVLATSPTTTAGGAIEVALTNQTGAAITGLTVSFDTVRYTAATNANELPGYWLFSSVDGTSWANVGTNPTIATVPNTVGVTSSGPFTFDLASSVAAGQTFYLRFVDDNAAQTSPDQILGLNNVSILPVPEPGTLAILGAGLAAASWRRARGRSAATA